MLREQGFNAFVIVGGLAAWRKAGQSDGAGAAGRSGEAAHIFMRGSRLRTRPSDFRESGVSSRVRGLRSEVRGPFPMASSEEIEIKFRVDNARALARRLRDGGLPARLPLGHSNGIRSTICPAARCRNGERCCACENMVVSGCSPTRRKERRRDTRCGWRPKLRSPTVTKLDKILRALGYAAGLPL